MNSKHLPTYRPHTITVNDYRNVTTNRRKYRINLTAFRRAAAFAFDKPGVYSDLWEDSTVSNTNPFSIEGKLTHSCYESKVANEPEMCYSRPYWNLTY